MSAVEEAYERWWRSGVGSTPRAAFYAGWEAANQPSLFDDSEPRTIPSRSTDPATSHAAVRAITVKAGSQRARLLQAFMDSYRIEISSWQGHFPSGLTDEEAMDRAVGVAPRSEFSKRCSELREAGYIEPTGETRPGSSGLQRIVSRITDKGRAAVRGL